MIYFKYSIILLLSGLIAACTGVDADGKQDVFKGEINLSAVSSGSVLFSGTDSATWDAKIRERGFIIYDEGRYKMWYTGYNPDSSALKFLGYATSVDGVKWDRYADNPIYRDKWTEDVFVMKQADTYYMFAEGADDKAHLLTSENGLQWTSKGDLTILTTKGDTIAPPYGTPTVFVEEDVWYLFYEKVDSAVWLATSEDLLCWKNIKDEPVLQPGPEGYDKGAIAANQIIKQGDVYYMLYHATSNPDWNKGGSPVFWNSNIAFSKDLLNWTKHTNNPIIENNESSPIWVDDGLSPKIYTMHKGVRGYFFE